MCENKKNKKATETSYFVWNLKILVKIQQTKQQNDGCNYMLSDTLIYVRIEKTK